MPELTIEYRWVCEEYYDWAARRDFKQDEPACRWSQDVDGGEPVDEMCPKCGGHVVAIRVAV